MRIALVLLFATFATVAFPAKAAEPLDRPWNHDIIYFALTDRFYDGDPQNNVPEGSDPDLYDKTQQDIGRYHGGDLRGLEIAIKDGYFEDLGVTALWITPPIKNVWNSLHDAGGAKTGYHGYWAQDFLDIDPHWTSATSLEGKPYENSRDGRMQHYKDFVALAHAHGLKVIQDIVLNHAGPVFYYDTNGNDRFDTNEANEWIQPFRKEGFYEDTKWADIPKWNAERTEPSGPVTVLGQEVKTKGLLSQLTTYSRKGFSPESLGKTDGEEQQCDFFSLRDLWEEAGSEHFDALVDEFVEIYAFYVEQIGVDGFRVDTVKHVRRAFWDAFTAKLRERIGPERAKHFIVFGEVYDGDSSTIGKYTYRQRDREGGICFDSVLNFPLCYAIREYLRPVIGPFGKAGAVERAWKANEGRSSQTRLPRFNPKPGADGLRATQKLINFVENHDGLNRFRVPPIGEKQNLLANAVAILSEGIPCLYYGTEMSLADAKGKVNKDGETGRFTFIPAGKPENFGYIRKSASFQVLKSIIALRKTLPPLQDGETQSIWADAEGDDSDDGVMAFSRYLPVEKPQPAADADSDTKSGDDAIAATDAAAPESVVVVINASERPRVTSAQTNRMTIVGERGKPLVGMRGKLIRQPVAGLDPAGTKEQEIAVPMVNGKPAVELIVGPQTVNIYRVRP